MIPVLRSFTELMIITQSKDEVKDQYKDEYNIVNPRDHSSNKSLIEKNKKKRVELPNIKQNSTRYWKENKKAVFDFLNSLDYNNQIQSSYDLTLLERQSQNSYHDAA